MGIGYGEYWFKEAADKYAAEKKITPRDCSKES